MNEEDAQGVTTGNHKIYYERPNKRVSYSNIRGINYQNVSKKYLVDALVNMWEEEDKLKKEFMHERIRNNILTKRMVESGLEVSLTPNEILEYKNSLSVALANDIDTIMSGQCRGIKEEIQSRVKSEIAKVMIDVESDFSYNVIRIENSIRACDLLEIEATENKRLNLKDKSSIILKVQKNKLSLIKELKEVMTSTGVDVKQSSKMNVDKPKDVISKKISLTDMYKGDE